MKQTVKMLKTQPGVDDGEIRPTVFMEGVEYEIGPQLLDSFIELGAVELKSEGDAPANKMKKHAPENKAR